MQVTVVAPDSGPEPSPASSPAGRRAFKFSSLKKRASKTPAACQDQPSRTTSEADIAAFQKELQNLPNFESLVSIAALAISQLRVPPPPFLSVYRSLD